MLKSSMYIIMFDIGPEDPIAPSSYGRALMVYIFFGIFQSKRKYTACDPRWTYCVFILWDNVRLCPCLMKSGHTFGFLGQSCLSATIGTVLRGLLFWKQACIFVSNSPVSHLLLYIHGMFKNFMSCWDCQQCNSILTLWNIRANCVLSVTIWWQVCFFLRKSHFVCRLEATQHIWFCF